MSYCQTTQAPLLTVIRDHWGIFVITVHASHSCRCVIILERLKSGRASGSFGPASLTTFTRSAVFRARTGRRLTSVGPAVVEKHLATHSAAAYLFNHVAQGARALVVCKRRRDTSPAGCVFIGCSAVAKLRQPAAPLWGLPGPLALALRGGPRQNASTASWGQPRALARRPGFSALHPRCTWASPAAAAPVVRAWRPWTCSMVTAVRLLSTEGARAGPPG